MEIKCIALFVTKKSLYRIVRNIQLHFNNSRHIFQSEKKYQVFLRNPIFRYTIHGSVTQNNPLKLNCIIYRQKNLLRKTTWSSRWWHQPTCIVKGISQEFEKAHLFTGENNKKIPLPRLEFHETIFCSAGIERYIMSAHTYARKVTNMRIRQGDCLRFIFDLYRIYNACIIATDGQLVKVFI